MSEKDNHVLGKNQVDIAIDNIIFEGLDDLVAAVEEAQKAAHEDGSALRRLDLDQMKKVLLSAKKEIARIQVEAGKREPQA